MITNDPRRERLNIAMQPGVVGARRDLSERLWKGFVKPPPLRDPGISQRMAPAARLRIYPLAELYDDTGDPKE